MTARADLRRAAEMFAEARTPSRLQVRPTAEWQAWKDERDRLLAALRALADRFDAEMARALQKAGKFPNLSECVALARLDASPIAPATPSGELPAWEWGPKQRGTESECAACLREGKTCVAGNGMEGYHCVYVSPGLTEWTCAFCKHPPNGAPPTREPCRPGCKLVDEGMGGAPVLSHQPGCPNGPWTKFMRAAPPGECNFGVAGCVFTHSCDPAVATHHIPTSPIAPPPVNSADHFRAAGKQCGACGRGDHANCSGWCFCPQGPCDEPKPAAPPGEPTCKTCDGSRQTSVFSSSRSDLYETVRPCPDCAASPEVPRCDGDCGNAIGQWNTRADGFAKYVDDGPLRVFCTPACRDAGRPLHPAQPGGSRP